MGYGQGNNVIGITIASGESESGEVEMVGYGARGLAVGILSDGWTAADIAFEARYSAGGTDYWLPLVDNAGDRVKITGVSTSGEELYSAPAEVWALGAFEAIRVCSINTSDETAAVTQDADRELVLVLQDV